MKEEIELEDHSDGSDQKDYFEYRENVQALYVDITKNFGEKWTAKAGVRFENTQTKGQSILEDEHFKRNYGKFFPSAFLNYQMDKNNVFNLSYSRRISRPGFWALNPSRWYINSTSYTEGNPFLQPKFTDNVTLKHIFKNKLISSLFISAENQGFDQIPSVDPNTKQQTYTFDNYYDLTASGLSETFSFQPFSWWKSTSQATLAYIDGKFKPGFENLGTFKNGLNFQFYTDHNFFLNSDKTLQLEATYNYSSPKKVLMYELGHTSSLDLGFKALFYNKRLKVSLAFQDIFKGNKPKITTYTNNIRQVYVNYFDSRNLKVSLTYKFGNEKLKSKKREVKNRDIQERTK